MKKNKVNYMYTEYSGFSQPPLETKIWRYINKEKIWSLFEKESLFFAKSSVLKDIFEGRYPTGYPKIQSGGLDRGGVDRMPLDRVYRNYIPKEAKDSIYICCFTMNDYENYSLWDVYLKPKKEGVAIQLTLDRLKKSLLPLEEEITSSIIKYSNFKKYDNKSQLTFGADIFPQFLNKKGEYNFENEIRVITNKLLPIREKNLNGIFLPINIQNFLEKIIISPGASNIFEENIRSLCLEKGLGDIVFRSTLEDKPEW